MNSFFDLILPSFWMSAANFHSFLTLFFPTCRVWTELVPHSSADERTADIPQTSATAFTFSIVRQQWLRFLFVVSQLIKKHGKISISVSAAAVVFYQKEWSSIMLCEEYAFQSEIKLNVTHLNFRAQTNKQKHKYNHMTWQLLTDYCSYCYSQTWVFIQAVVSEIEKKRKVI